MNNLQFIREKKLIVLVVLYIMLDFLSRLPYLNLYLRPWSTFSLLWLYIVFIYSLKYRYTFGIIVLALCISAVADIFNREYIAEDLGNLIYILFVIGTIQFFFEMVVKNKK